SYCDHSDLHSFPTRRSSDLKHALSDFSIILNALSLSFSFFTTITGLSSISLTINLPSIFSTLPVADESKDINSSFEFSAIARNVVIRQLLAAAIYKCSGDHIFGTPLGNSGGVATVILFVRSGAVNVPILPSSHFIDVL